MIDGDELQNRGLVRVYVAGFCLVMMFSVLLPLGVHNRAITRLQEELRTVQDELARVQRACDDHHRTSERRHQEILTELRRISQNADTPKGKP